MAGTEEEYLLRNPNEHALICEKHNLTIDLTCDDCEEFICSKCVKENHRDHDWKTISAAATIQKRGQIKTLVYIETEYIPLLDKLIQKTREEMEVNEKRCEIEVSRLRKTRDEMVEKVNELKKKQENIMKDNLTGKNFKAMNVKTKLEDKRTKTLMYVRSLRANNITMSDRDFLNTHRKLTKLMSYKDDEIERSFFALRQTNGQINEENLMAMVGQHFDSAEITVIETNNFQWGNQPINMLIESDDEDTRVLQNEKGQYFEVNKQGEVEKQFSTDVHVNEEPSSDKCLALVPDSRHRSINALLKSGSVYSDFSMDPLEPIGICIAIGVVVSLKDTVSDNYQLNSRSRRLVRYLLDTNDVEREYEYKEDGQTRLFTLPWRVAVSGILSDDSRVCVINRKSETSGELVVLPLYSTYRSTVYRGHDQRKPFNPTDVVCDPHSNIILNNTISSEIHLLNADGAFLRFLLTEKQVNHPIAMSLKDSSLWIGDLQGLIKVFEYEYSTPAENPPMCRIL